MRRRLTTVLVLLIAGTLLLSGFGTLFVARRAARGQAATQLLAEAKDLSSLSSEIARARGFLRLNAVLSPLGGRILVIRSPGTIAQALPAGLTADQIEPSALLQGSDVSGWVGAAVFAAVPLRLSPHLTAALPSGTRIALLLTRQVGTLGPSVLYVLLVSGVALVVAAAVAAWFTDRITRPLVEASAVTSRIAGGELSARVPTRPGEYPELQLLGDSINTMAERLSGGRERERQLLLSVSHDLRTPLTSIRGYAEAIEEGVATDVGEAAGVIVNESRRLERLVADLLDLARIGASQLSLRIGPTDIGAVIGSTVEALRPRAVSSGIRLETRQSAPGLLVAADPDRLSQVIANLVENALGFASESVTVSIVGGQPGTLPSSEGSPAAWSQHLPPPPPLLSAPGPAGSWPVAGRVLVLVEDDGPGIAPQDIERVFDRFYQGDQGMSARRGLGLGLSIVAELLRAMGGRITAESPTRGATGTRMVVELPEWLQPSAPAPRA